MAMPINPTPVLRDKEATAFERRLSEQREAPLKVTRPPNLEAAKKAVFGAGKLPSK